MNELISTFTDPKTWIVVYFTIAFISGTGIIYLWVLSAKHWRKIKDSLYAKAIVKIAELQDLLSKKSIRCLDQSIHIELLKDELKTAEQSTKRKSLRKEIARLKQLNQGLATKLKIEVERNKNIMLSKYKLIEEVNEYKERIQHLTETIEKRKHQPIQKDVESDWWKSITDFYPQFPKGEIFQTGSKTSAWPGFFVLVATNGGSIDCVVEKRNFKPVKIM